MAVRHGHFPDHPNLVSRYLRLGAEHVKAHSDARWCFHLHRFNTLLDTICDTNVPLHWRCLCLNSIYLPLHTMERLAESGERKKQIHRLRYELRVLSNYFM